MFGVKLNSNKQINIQVFNNTYDNKVVDDYRYELTWQEFVEFCSEPSIVKNKNDARLITPVEFYGKEDAELTDDGFVRRCSNNVKNWTMLPIDVDKDMTIREALLKFKDHEYVLYTSFNHQLQKGDEPPCDRFRMFFLLEQPIDNHEFKIRRQSLKQFIEFLDPTSLSVSRAFYQPSCSEDMYKHSIFHHNKGKTLNVMNFEPEKESEYVPVAGREDIEDEMKQAVLNNLPNIGNVEYDVWWKIGSAMAASGYSYEDFEWVSRTIRSHRTDRKCRAQWASSQRTRIDFGYLVNLLKDKIGTDWMPKTKVNKTYSEEDRKIASLYAQLKQIKRKGK
ncbi:PriCT-2 domain-containing protein [Methylobacter sp.]|uniref:PriCT-2 domain-containing protein n=1 Tax=Methylobacter sp. TaxID=2051955 RepID=UPI003DA5C115